MQLDRVEHTHHRHHRRVRPALPCQGCVSAPADAAPVPADSANLIHQLAVGDAAAVARIIDQAWASDDVTTLISAALFAPDPTDLLQHAAAVATTTRDRQVVAIAAAHRRRQQRPRRRAGP